jgi:hypothetical protein
MSFLDRIKCFLWKWWVLISTFGMFEGEAILECTRCGIQYAMSDMQYHMCPRFLDDEDED